MKPSLHGIRVLDLSRVLAGPWASQLLGDYGAEVVKIERPVSGDDTRHWGPPWLSGEAGESAYFLATNRNKRSVAIDLDSADGQELVRQMASRADIVIENFKPGSLARRGLDYESLSSANRGLVYCRISAYSSDSSLRNEPGYDAMIQASAGLMSLTGAPDSEGGKPQKVGVAITDIMAGMYAVTAILAALHARTQSGVGQLVEVPLFDSQVAWLANQNLNYLISGKAPERLGNAHPNIVPYQDFRTADSYLMLAVGNDRQFHRCLAAIGLDQHREDARFSTNKARVAHREELVRLLADTFIARTTADWLAILRAAGVPSGPVNNLAQVFASPYAQEQQLMRTLQHPDRDELPTVANPVRFSATPVRYGSAPPLLGQHTDEVLQEWLGYSADDILRAKQSGAV
ncbi:MAG TPA: CaiB/BaiF CoA-transferase family protein [Woeseiaceae bacterium]|nr:CaiB/BaiF CoA-transferase family protein [Woeseiaceae bacterium]